MRTPRGFRYAGINAGIKAIRKDLALFESELPCAAAGLFTINRARAAPVIDAASRLPAMGVRALVANSGNANALTGKKGLEDARAMCAAYAAELGVPAEAVLVASTGVIGVPLPVDKLIGAAPALLAARREGMEAAADAILTTDTRPKLATRVLRVGESEVVIAACAKGSGMVAPALATMMAIITTDAAIAPAPLQAMLARAVDASFHDLVIDGEMSTNDAVFAFANGASGVAVENEPAFEAELIDLCRELARAIAEDGEGATKTLTVRTTGAPDRAIARDVARAIAASTLVKAAVFGADPNWGRVLATVGARAATRNFSFDPEAARVAIQGVVVFDRGAPAAFDAVDLRARMRRPQVSIDVALGIGPGEGEALGCDLSYDYVKINADYASTITASAEGVVTRDDRLANYTPALKRAIVVEALSYISKFAGRRAVLCVRGESLVRDALKASFAADVNLLVSAGLHPIVVHGGGPEISKTLERLGARAESVGATDPRLVEMVLSGRVNAELVSLLNQEHARAVGISGKDGGLLRARRREEGTSTGPREGSSDVRAVDAALVELLLGKAYVPVIAPIGLGDDGEGLSVDTHAAAAAIAIALRADKLIILADAPGIVQAGELVSELTSADLRKKIDDGVVSGGMLALAHSALHALAGGVPRVHVVDGRVPHGVVAELFTDRGVGTLITE